MDCEVPQHSTAQLPGAAGTLLVHTSLCREQNITDRVLTFHQENGGTAAAWSTTQCTVKRGRQAGRQAVAVRSARMCARQGGDRLILITRSLPPGRTVIVAGDGHSHHSFVGSLLAYYIQPAPVHSRTTQSLCKRENGTS